MLASRQQHPWNFEGRSAGRSLLARGHLLSFGVQGDAGKFQVGLGVQA